MEIRVFFIALLVASPFLRAARCQSESQDEGTDDSGDLEIVNGTDEIPFCGDENFSPATGVQTVCVFPKNIAKLVSAGEETELLIGIKYDGDSNVNVVAIKASVHLSYDHRMLVENLTAQVFNNASVPPSVQATFPYIFAVSKFLQPGSFDLVGTIVYEIDQQPYQSTFYNGTIEVVKPSGFLSVETHFLAMLGFALLAARWLWIHCRIQSPSKVSPNKRKAVPRCQGDVLAYRTRIKRYVDAGRFELVDALCEEMEKRGITPDTATRNIVLSGYGKAGEYGKMERVLGRMLGSTRCPPDVGTMNTIVAMFGDKGQIEMMERWFEQFQDFGIEPDAATRNIVLSVYGKAGRYVQMERELWRMIESPRCPPDVGTMNTIVAVFGDKGQIEMMERWFEKFRDFGIEPEMSTFKILIDAYRKKGLYDHVSFVMKNMRELGLREIKGGYY